MIIAVSPFASVPCGCGCSKTWRMENGEWRMDNGEWRMVLDNNREPSVDTQCTLLNKKPPPRATRIHPPCPGPLTITGFRKKNRHTGSRILQFAASLIRILPWHAGHDHQPSWSTFGCYIGPGPLGHLQMHTHTKVQPAALHYCLATWRMLGQSNGNSGSCMARFMCLNLDLA